MAMQQPIDLRAIWESHFNKVLQVETKSGDIMQGKLIIVDMYSGRCGTLRRITDMKAYHESHGMRGVQEVTIHTIDIKSWKALD
jgi:hypothetical protein